MKKIWKKTEGFSLVELVVVIAILGILAGVGTVGYSGYVKKANAAADEQLLHDLNNAFSAACVANGVDMLKLNQSTAKIDLNDEHKVETIEIAGENGGSAREDFLRFYTNEAFKNISHIFYNNAPDVLRFVSGMRLPVGDNVALGVTGQLIELLGNSSYKTSDSLEALLNAVKQMGGLAYDTMGDDNGGAGTSPAGNKTVANAVNALTGTKDANESSENLQKMFDDAVAAYKEEQVQQAVDKKIAEIIADEDYEGNIESVKPEDIEKYKNDNADDVDRIKGDIADTIKSEDIINNALAIGAAQNSANASKEEVLGVIETILPGGSDNQDVTKEELMQAVQDANMSEQDTALLYSMMLAYAESAGYEMPEDDADIQEFISGLETEEVNKLLGYLDSDQVGTDMDAYIELMEAMTGTSVGQDTIDNFLTGGMVDEDLINSLLGLLG